MGCNFIYVQLRSPQGFELLIRAKWPLNYEQILTFFPKLKKKHLLCIKIRSTCIVWWAWASIMMATIALLFFCGNDGREVFSSSSRRSMLFVIYYKTLQLVELNKLTDYPFMTLADTDSKRWNGLRVIAVSRDYTVQPLVVPFLNLITGHEACFDDMILPYKWKTHLLTVFSIKNHMKN